MEEREKRTLENLRKPFQGVWNIIQFNWHYYVLSIAFFVILLCCIVLLDIWNYYIIAIAFIPISTVVISLAASYYIYDVSDLYSFNWLTGIGIKNEGLILNVNAGFDETSKQLFRRFPDAQLLVYDFYDKSKHTEISIERARKKYPPYPGTIRFNTSDIPLNELSINSILVFFSAHEIRNSNERVVFFRELNRVLVEDGTLIVTEHLRDVANFIAYNIGFFHFYSKKSWEKVFNSAGFEIKFELKITRFISTFVLKKHGTSP